MKCTSLGGMKDVVRCSSLLSSHILLFKQSITAVSSDRDSQNAGDVHRPVLCLLIVSLLLFMCIDIVNEQNDVCKHRSDHIFAGMHFVY